MDVNKGNSLFFTVFQKTGFLSFDHDKIVVLPRKTQEYFFGNNEFRLLGSTLEVLRSSYFTVLSSIIKGFLLFFKNRVFFAKSSRLRENV